MRAYEVGPEFGLAHLKIVERPMPKPGYGELLVRIRACSLNFRDWLVVEGHYNSRLKLPRIPASDGAGVIVECGPGVTGFQAGDRVTGCLLPKWNDGPLTADAARFALGGQMDGTLAEYVIWSADGVIRTPGWMTDAQAATLPCAALTAWHAIVELGIQPGDSVLIQGTGGVAVFALQFALLAGARTIVTSRSEKKLAVVRQMGAHETICTVQSPQWEAVVLELTDGKGVDQVVELGGAGTMPQSVKAVRHGGRINMIGVLAGTSGQFNPLTALMKAIRIQGIFVGSTAMFERMLRAMTLHRTAPVIDRQYPFESVPQALQDLVAAQHMGKLVITVAE